MVQFLVIAQTASFKCVKCCYFSIAVPNGTLPRAPDDPDPEPRRGCGSGGLGPQGEAARVAWELEQENVQGAPHFPPDGSRILKPR